MHELSLCKAIIDSINSEIKKLKTQPKQINVVRIVAGELHYIVKDNMELIFNELSKNTIMENSKLEILFKPLMYRCLKCGNEGEIIKSNFYCIKCNSSDIDIISGKELYLESIEVEEDE